MVRYGTRDYYRFDLLRDGPLTRNLGKGQDEVFIRTRSEEVDHIRLNFNRSEVGDGNPYTVNPLPGQGAGLAVRIQAEDDAGLTFGPVSRFDDEGITFRTQSREIKFDIRDISDASIGLFDVAVLGTTGRDSFDFRDEKEDFYIQAGMGDDLVIGGRGEDYLIGGFGNDLVRGGSGDDVVIGGPGVDRLEGGGGNDTAVYRVGLDAADQVNLGTGNDVVQVLGAPGEVRLTLSTLQAGDGNSKDSGVLTNEDGALAIRFQQEDAAGNLTGPVSRYDDEGISFIGGPGITFDIRNLADGAERGSGYGIARFGSQLDDVYDDTTSTVDVFTNGGQGNDRIIGGSGDDHLVGLDGDDWLEGGLGDDLLVGLAGVDTFAFSGDPGRDVILTYEAGTDRIDLSAYGIDLSDVEATQSGPNTIVQVDTDSDGVFDFEIFLGGSTPPLTGDYLF